MWKKKDKKSRTDFKLPFPIEDDQPSNFDEADLENELMDILGSDTRPAVQRNRSGPNQKKSGTETPLLRDLVMEDSISGSIEVDENDPELMAELAAFVSEKESPPRPSRKTSDVPLHEAAKSSVSLSEVNDRLNAYRVALQNLKNTQPSESAKIRRYGRAIQQLEGYASDLSRGKSVNATDLPPPPPTSLLSDEKPKEQTAPKASDSGLLALKKRNDEYRLAASKARAEGNTKRAQALLTASQMIEEVIPKIEAGLEPFDVETDLPPPPDEFEIDESTDEPEPAPPSPTPAVPQPLVESKEAPAPSIPMELATDSETKDPRSAGVAALKMRSQEYKIAAVKARDSGNLERAKALLRASKMIDEVIPKVASGEEPFSIDTDLPPPPDEFELPPSEASEPGPNASVSGSHAPITIPQVARSSAVTVENIRARLEYYKTSLADAQTRPSEASRQRRLQRIINNYNEGLKACEHGVTSYNYSELPPPPNCPLLSGPPVRSQTASSADADSSRPGPAASKGESRTERMVTLLRTRQSELKAAALAAKQNGNMDLARVHLRSALSINPMIESAQAGLSVDLSKLPRAPTSGPRAGELSKQAPVAISGPILSGTACDPPQQFLLELNAVTGDSERNQLLLKFLEQQHAEASTLARNLETSGWTERAQKMSELVALSKASLQFGQQCVRQNRPIPYAFESANLPVLNMNADLSDDVLEVCIVRGFAYPLPSKISDATQLDTYVEVQFPYPSTEKAQKHSTAWCKHSTEPNYDSVVKFEADTKSRTYARFTQGGREVKATVYYNAGLLRGSRPLGTASFSLSELSQSATINPVVDLLDGRRAVGGRLMLRFRQRAPLSGPPIITNRKPWLTITTPKSSTTRLSPTSSVNPSSGSHGRLQPERPMLGDRIHSDPHHDRRSPGSLDVPRRSADRSRHSSRDGRVPSTERKPQEGAHRSSGRTGVTIVRSAPTDPGYTTGKRSHDYSCLSVLRADRAHFSQCLKNPQLSDADRQDYIFRLGEVEKRYERLKQRIQTGPNADREVEVYLSELEVLQTEWRHKYDMAKSHGDQNAIRHYAKRLELVAEELRHHHQQNRG